MSKNDVGDDFPWHLGVYDAHCHPTDTMSSVPSIPNMKAKGLAIMATRAQDQDLVVETARKHAIKRSACLEEAEERGSKVVPCFGWHPWFSYQIYDDRNVSTMFHGKAELNDEEKVKHYSSVLSPKRDLASVSEEDRRLFLSLPSPQPLSTFLDLTHKNLTSFPTALVGEVGLDRSFRIPLPWSDIENHRDDSLTPGGREGRKLSPFRVDMEHQKLILLAQLGLAAQENRAVSLHGVQAHGILFETVKSTWKGKEKKVRSKKERKRDREEERMMQQHQVNEDEGSVSDLQNNDNTEKEDTPPYPPRICLHSYSGNPSSFRQWLDPSIPLEVYASFSTAINCSDKHTSGNEGEDDTPENLKELIRIVPDDRILTESDLHVAGDRMDAYLQDIARRICRIKGWELEDGLIRLGRNWRRFVFGKEID